MYTEIHIKCPLGALSKVHVALYSGTEWIVDTDFTVNVSYVLFVMYIQFWCSNFEVRKMLHGSFSLNLSVHNTFN